MKAEEKQLLYSFFLTASQAIEGFRLPNYLNPQSIQFVDDEEIHVRQEEKEKSCPHNFGKEVCSHSYAGKTVTVASSTGIGSLLTTSSTTAFKTYTSLEEVEADIAICTLCPLCKTRQNIVVGEGPKQVSGSKNDPLILVIGEAPGAEEDKMARPFVGASGKLLDKMLAAIELSRNTNCFITNMVKCRPPDNRNPTPNEISLCSHFLQEQIRLLSPKMILLLGTVALKAMFQTSDGIMHLHGRLMHYKLKLQSNENTEEEILIPTIPTYHPSALLRNESLKRPAWDDLKFFKAKLNEFLH